MEDQPISRFEYQRTRIWRAAKGAVSPANNYASYIGPAIIAVVLGVAGFKQVGPTTAEGAAFWTIAAGIASWGLFFAWRLFVTAPYEMQVEAVTNVRRKMLDNETLAAMLEANRISEERLELDRQRLTQKGQAAVDAGAPSKTIEFEFDNECNEEHVESLFKRSIEFLPSGHEMDRGLVSINQFFIGVRNPATAKTLKNVRVIVHAIGGAGPTWPVDLSLVAHRTKSDAVDIPPGRTDFFLLGRNIVNSREGMFHPQIVSYQAYLEQVAERDRRASQGLVVSPMGNKEFPLLKNDGYKINVSAYADDVSPTEAVITVNARKRTVVLID